MPDFNDEFYRWEYEKYGRTGQLSDRDRIVWILGYIRGLRCSKPEPKIQTLRQQFDAEIANLIKVLNDNE